MHWLRNFDLFLFDFDGLLVNTEAVHYQAYQRALAKEGYRLDWSYSEYAKVSQLDAASLRIAIYNIFPDLDPDWDRIYKKKTEAYQDLLMEGSIQFMPGVEDLLQILEKENVRRCVVTNSLLHQVDAIRLKLPLLNTIPNWVVRESYRLPKPDPDCYFTAIKMYGRPLDRMIGFEDSIRGWQALRATSALAVLICSKEQPFLQAALELGAIHFESFSQISYNESFNDCSGFSLKDEN